MPMPRLQQSSEDRGKPHGGAGPARSETTLRDGQRLQIRRLTPEDAPVVERAFARLSEESRRLRFLTSKPRLTRSELRYLTEVDGHQHEALVAVDPVTRQGVGIARFVRDPEEERFFGPH